MPVDCELRELGAIDRVLTKCETLQAEACPTALENVRLFTVFEITFSWTWIRSESAQVIPSRVKASFPRRNVTA